MFSILFVYTIMFLGLDILNDFIVKGVIVFSNLLAPFFTTK